MFETNNIDIVKCCQYCFGLSYGLSAIISLTRESRNVIIRSSLDSAIANVNSANKIIS